MSNPPFVLVVDDDPNFREIFSTTLTAAGFRVEMAVNGKEGVEKTFALHPDLVLMDVQMPVLNGIDAFLKIKGDPRDGNVKVIFLTVLGDPRVEVQEINRRLSRELGAVGYIKKTDAPDLLVNHIKSLFALAS